MPSRYRIARIAPRASRSVRTAPNHPLVAGLVILLTASIVERNAAAAKVMAEHDIAINDLYAAITPRLAELQRPDDCHFTGPGNNIPGEAVAAFLESRIGASDASSGTPRKP
jgi:hypothetical protein